MTDTSDTTASTRRVPECNCQTLPGIPSSVAEVDTRCSQANDLIPNLLVIVSDGSKWMSVLQCRSCGTLWAQEYPYSEYHGGGSPLFYQIDTADPRRWLEEAEPLGPHLRQNADDLAFLAKLGAEVGPEPCPRNGCANMRISQSVLCRKHPFESIKSCPLPSRPEYAAAAAPNGQSIPEKHED